MESKISQQLNLVNNFKTVHFCKLFGSYFREVESGEKTFEIRYNDRDYKRGDCIVLQEFLGDKYTGNELVFKIGYITAFEQKDNYVVFSLLKI